MSLPPYPPVDQIGRRIIVVGATGSGKTTLATCLAHRLGLRHIEMDALNWGPGWQAAAPEVLAERALDAIAAAPGWVMDGNYKVVRAATWPLAETIVWLDYPLGLVLWRVTRRTLQRILRREVLWNGNIETLRAAFFSRDSLFLYAIKSHRIHRAQYPRLVREEYPHLRLLRFCNPDVTARWVGST